MNPFEKNISETIRALFDKFKTSFEVPPTAVEVSHIVLGYAYTYVYFNCGEAVKMRVYSTGDVLKWVYQ